MKLPGRGWEIRAGRCQDHCTSFILIISFFTRTKKKKACSERQQHLLTMADLHVYHFPFLCQGRSLVHRHNSPCFLLIMAQQRETCGSSNRFLPRRPAIAKTAMHARHARHFQRGLNGAQAGTRRPASLGLSVARTTWHGSNHPVEIKKLNLTSLFGRLLERKQRLPALTPHCVSSFQIKMPVRKLWLSRLNMNFGCCCSTVILPCTTRPNN